MVAVTSPGLVVLPAEGLVEVEGTSPSIGGYAPLATWETGRRYQLIVASITIDGTDVTERRIAELRGAVVRSASWRLNATGQMSFTLSAADEAAIGALIDADTVYDGAGRPALLGVEVQLWVDGQRWWWGPPVAAEVDMDASTVTVHCYDAGWYLERRFMGAAERRDLLEGIGSFDVAGIPGWTKVGVTAARDVSEKVRGTGSVLLTGTGAMHATFIHPPPTISTTAFLAGWMRLPADVPEGTLVAQIASRRTADPTETPFDERYIYTDDQTPLEQWTPLGTDDSFVRIPHGANTYVTVTLWKPMTGNWRFDEVKVQKNDATGINPPGSDLVQHFKAILHHAQEEVGKGTFGLNVQVVEETGTVEPMGIRHVQHDQVTDVLTTYTEREDGFDWWPDPFTRTLFVGPRRGVDHDRLVLHQRIVSGGGWNHDESKRASSVVVIGDGDGIDRPEGGYLDASSTAGLVLDDLYRAPSGTPIAALASMARQRHAKLSQPQVTPKVRVSADLWPNLDCGDTVDVEFKVGVWRMPSQRIRIQQIELDPATDMLELV